MSEISPEVLEQRRKELLEDQIKFEQKRQEMIKNIAKFEKDNNISHKKMCKMLDKRLKNR